MEWNEWNCKTIYFLIYKHIILYVYFSLYMCKLKVSFWIKIILKIQYVFIQFVTFPIFPTYFNRLSLLYFEWNWGLGQNPNVIFEVFMVLLVGSFADRHNLIIITHLKKY